MKSYLNLCTEFYDLINPKAGFEEIAYYEALLRPSKGPILEAMCGSGRLLIPLLKKRLLIDGVDNSNHMLQSCQRRSKDQGLEVQLHQQALQTLSLPKKYHVIFIAIGSFQLIRKREEALQILKSLRAALSPEGQLILETFVPWAASKEHALTSNEISFERTTYCTDGSEIICKTKATIDLKEQLEVTQIRYEKWADHQLIDAADEEHIIRWYHSYQMESLLKEAGFSSIQQNHRKIAQNEYGVIYQASNTTDVTCS